jgi:hypothetical protein
VLPIAIKHFGRIPLFMFCTRIIRIRHPIVSGVLIASDPKGIPGIAHALKYRTDAVTVNYASNVAVVIDENVLIVVVPDVYLKSTGLSEVSRSRLPCELHDHQAALLPHSSFWHVFELVPIVLQPAITRLKRPRLSMWMMPSSRCSSSSSMTKCIRPICDRVMS